MGCGHSNAYRNPPTDLADQEHLEEHPQEPRPNARSAVTQLLCGIYALIMVVLGVVFPIATSLTTTTPGETKYYLESFHLYLYGVSLIFLFYLHCYLLQQKGDEKAVRNIRLVSNNQLDSPDKSALAVQENSEISSGHSQGKRSRTPSDVELEPYEPPPRPVTYDSPGANFYLRLGAIVFGAGSMIHDGFRIAQIIEVKNYWECFGLLHLVMFSLHLVFAFFQTFFLFKNHRLVINKHKAFVRWGLTHIIATNICIWALATILETEEDYETRKNMPPISTSTPGDDLNTTATTTYEYVNVTTVGTTVSTSESCYSVQTLARKAAPYLFPCTVQYSLIAVGIVYKMYRNVGKVASHVITIATEDQSGQRDCHKANKGLFLGLFITILTLISISCFFVFEEKFKNTDIASLIFYITEVSLLFLSAIIVFFGFCRIQQLKFVSVDEPLIEAPLLVVALFGLCLMNTFLIVSSAWSIQEYHLIAIFSLSTAGLAFVQASVQTVFILDGLRRCAETDNQVQKKPGRTLVTFLLMCNLSLFVVNTFEERKAESVSLHTAYYGYLPWNILSHLCIPFIIFFRFHSAVCLSEIWLSAYAMQRRDL